MYVNTEVTGMLCCESARLNASTHPFFVESIQLHFHSWQISINHMSHDMRFPTKCGMCDQQSLISACAYPQSDQSLC